MFANIMKVSSMIFEWYKNISSRLECRSFSSKISDYVDGRLDGNTAWRVQNHISVCNGCQSAVTAQSSISHLLSRSSRREVSADFGDALEARIALLPKKTAANVRSPRIVQPLWPTLNASTLRVTAPFAAAAAVVMLSLFVIKPVIGPVVVPVPLTVPHTLSAPDPTVYVDLHRTESAGDPLSDSSAQLLGSSVDTIKVNPSSNHNLSDDDVSVLLD